mgnify:CR=1 FL=1
MHGVAIAHGRHLPRSTNAVPSLIAPAPAYDPKPRFCAILIGRIAADLVKDGETVLINSGSTTRQVIRRLEPRRGIRIVTNNIAAAAVLLSLESVFAALGGWWLLGETLSPRGLAGCGLMFAGVLISQLGGEHDPDAEAAALRRPLVPPIHPCSTRVLTQRHQKLSPGFSFILQRYHGVGPRSHPCPNS